MNNYYYIFIEKESNISYEQVKEKMDKALDWVQITNSCWVVYSSSNEDKWVRRLERLVKPNGSLFISKLDISQSNGWMSNAFWTWIKKKR